MLIVISGKLATIQPLPQIPIPPQSKLSVKCLTGSSLSSSTASLTISQQSSPPPRPGKIVTFYYVSIHYANMPFMFKGMQNCAFIVA